MRGPRRTMVAGVICSLTLTFAGLASTAGVASAAAAPSASTVAAAPAAHAVQPDAFGWVIYNYYPNNIWGLTHCNIDGTAMKVGGAIIDYRCWVDSERDQYALSVYEQIT